MTTKVNEYKRRNSTVRLDSGKGGAATLSELLFCLICMCVCVQIMLQKWGASTIDPEKAAHRAVEHKENNAGD